MAEGRAPARAALAGNPSDGYGGAVLAVTVEAFAAQALVRPAATGDAAGGAEPTLVEATVRRFYRDVLPAAPPSRAAWSTTIPRSVGLGGSSAIVIATLRALCAHHGLELGSVDLAELALSVEVDDLGIAAGLQDRIAQSFGGVTFMDFGRPPRYERLDSALLPPLLVAWREHTGSSSGGVHGDLRRRYDAGDPGLQKAMAELAGLARAARDALLAGDHATLGRCADASFDVRTRILTLDPRHVEMVHIARSAGAAANYAGSGGAIVCVCRDLPHRAELARALELEACGTVEI